MPTIPSRSGIFQIAKVTQPGEELKVRTNTSHPEKSPTGCDGPPRAQGNDHIDSERLNILNDSYIILFQIITVN
jgi:hypothetical protein